MINKTRKPLLTEAVTARFMKLASLEPLAPRFLKEMYEEEEGKKREEEGQNLSKTPVKQGGNKTLAERREEEEESRKREEEGRKREEEQNLHEVMPEEGAPEAPIGGDPSTDMDPESHVEPDGDEGVGSESMVQDLVKAIANAISQQTGVAVDVDGSGRSGGEEAGGTGMPTGGDMGNMPPPGGPAGSSMPPKPEEGEDEEEMKMRERAGHRDHSGATYIQGQPQESREREEENQLKEEFSQAPKVTQQNKSNQGAVKDPYKSQVKVAKVEKPDAYLGKTSAGYPNHMKNLTEEITKRVFTRIMEDLKKIKAVKENKNSFQTS